MSFFEVQPVEKRNFPLSKNVIYVTFFITVNGTRQKHIFFVKEGGNLCRF